MPKWIPEAMWEGSSAVIIGGGDSLRAFPWHCLLGDMTIGCNVAYKLGADVCRVVIFGDDAFFKQHEKGLMDYGGAVFTNACPRKLVRSGNPPDWIYYLRREPKGLHLNALGWNGNTGASAINLAFLFGCPKVYLLGFDMKFRQDKKNWHDEYLPKQKKKRRKKLVDPFPAFVLGFDDVVKDWKTKFADREIINVNDDSALTCFPMMSVADFLKERGEK